MNQVIGEFDSPLAHVNILTSKFFNSDDELGVQGQVLGEVMSGVYLVEFYSWLNGEVTSQRVMAIGDMVGWDFYSRSEDMHDHYERVIRVRREIAIDLALSLSK